MIFYSLLKFYVHVFAQIVLFQDIEKLIEVITVLIYLMELIPAFNQCENITHLVTENTYSKNKEEARQKSLAVRPWVEVSKPDRRQGRHWVIDTNPGNLRITFLVQPKIFYVIFLYFILVCVTNFVKFCALEILANVALDVPKLSEKVTHCENDHHQLHQSKKQFDVKQQLNSVQVYICVFAYPRIILDSFGSPFLKVGFEKLHDFLNIENFETSNNSDNFYHLKVLFKVPW